MNLETCGEFKDFSDALVLKPSFFGSDGQNTYCCESSQYNFERKQFKLQDWDAKRIRTRLV